MSFASVKQYFEEKGLGDRVMEFDQSSATVEEAAKAVGCQPRQIAKTLSFLVDDHPVLIVAAGDRKVDNKKYKSFFHQKAKMIPGDQVEARVGHAPGGVCPFVIQPDVSVYLDVSLQRFDAVYPAAGSGNSAVKLALDELEKCSHSLEWIDVCKE
ncbi:MAG TPA: YbaK/EbsC family protein [Candidatus Blautia gallistercoris]|uniref:YbaK/EbsC family protein n=1 Tax=Candidatus Blautia gallistercoris TaxID=2838490 RepID=A0A9D1WJV7_9FIRM|nr:YbaK/EbsC family protein [Candidatus Blautia gallistercoris]